MIESLTAYMDAAGPFAPLVYVSFFIMTALLPFIPTPLVSALGGSVLGFTPALLYGIVGLAIGALVALNLSRFLGRPVLLRVFGRKAWDDWEVMLGIRSPVLWGVIFFVLNIDFAVVAAGLSGIALWKLWLAALVARIPWVLVTAWFGDAFLVSDTYLLPGLAIGLIALVLVNLVRPRLRAYLVRKALERQADPRRAARAQRFQARRNPGRTSS